MDWRHEVSADWLKERKKVITATEIAGLVTSAAKAKGKVPQAFKSFWLEKTADEELETRSFSSAARGHIMEPYAVADYNRCNGIPRFYHWDDCIITRNGVGFSPDALNREQDESFGVHVECTHSNRFMSDYSAFDGKLPTKGLEIKSYLPKSHANAYFTPKMKLKERWQLAVAMYVLPCIKEMRILFYCPQAEISMFERTFSRDELAEELELIEQVVDLWDMTCKEMEEIKAPMKASFTEFQIWKENCYDAM